MQLDKTVLAFGEEYKTFLNTAKTERESVEFTVQSAKSAGYTDGFTQKTYKTGDKIYFINRDKNAVFFIIGKRPLTDGFNLTAAHVDAPRLDLKQNPLCEEAGLAMLKTHYYGGIKKYQWASRPLALHGVICLRDGSKVTLNIGENDGDPIFIIPDLLPHLDKKAQRERTSAEILKGEEMKLLVGSIPVEGEEKDRVKKAVLAHLKETYGVEEEDFSSADLELTPVGKAYDVGFDRSMVAAYAHDDRLCSYTAFRALLDMTATPAKTACVFLADKEEIGSIGATGMDGEFLSRCVIEVLRKTGLSTDNAALSDAFWSSAALSADVGPVFDPIFKEVHDEQNAAKMNAGLGISKATGSGGKSGGSEADAETVAALRALLTEHKIPYQVCDMGKVDEGGGGTVARYLARKGMRVIDCGGPVLSIHAPYEIASKIDIYANYLAYKAFLEHGLPF